MELSSLEYSQLCVNLDLLERNYARLQYQHYQILYATLPFSVDLSVLQYQLRCMLLFISWQWLLSDEDTVNPFTTHWLSSALSVLFKGVFLFVS